jgi:hypothetical protein
LDRFSQAFSMAYEQRRQHPAVASTLARFNESLPGFEDHAERVLVACSLSFNGYGPDEDLIPPVSFLLEGIQAGSWLPLLLSAIETAPGLDPSERQAMVGAYIIVETMLFADELRGSCINTL